MMNIHRLQETMRIHKKAQLVYCESDFQETKRTQNKAQLVYCESDFLHKW